MNTELKNMINLLDLNDNIEKSTTFGNCRIHNILEYTAHVTNTTCFGVRVKYQQISKD